MLYVKQLCMRLKIERYDNAGIKDFLREADQDDLG